MKNLVKLSILLMITPALCACVHNNIQTRTGDLGHRADNLKNYVETSVYDNNVEIKSNVIYLGKEYENNTFGPGRIKFVFEK